MSSNSGKPDNTEEKTRSRSILKSSTNVSKVPEPGKEPKFKWDEKNIKETLHPATKDYGHMKVEEPKTPYHYDEDEPPTGGVDPALLAEKLKIAEKSSKERDKKKDFEEKRTSHYNEFSAVKVARELMEKDKDLLEADSKDQKKGKPVKKEPPPSKSPGSRNDQPSTSK